MTQRYWIHSENGENIFKLNVHINENYCLYWVLENSYVVTEPER